MSEKEKEIQEQERPALKTQSLIFAKEKFDTADKALKWARDHNFKADKVDDQENTFRVRQFDSNRCQEGTFKTFRIADGVQGGGCQLKPEFREEHSAIELLEPPRSIVGLDVGATLAIVAEAERKFTQEESGFKMVSDSPDRVCGSCRFYLRDQRSEIGRCQVVDGEIPWFATSNLYISADAEARIAFANTVQRESMKKESDKKEDLPESERVWSTEVRESVLKEVGSALKLKGGLRQSRLMKLWNEHSLAWIKGSASYNAFPGADMFIKFYESDLVVGNRPGDDGRGTVSQKLKSGKTRKI